ncbi:Heavy-metal resistance [Aliiroseovarius crassostreae]|uniref:Periplasmic heavy metal sensor n=1 Tax=Aliiroseovarius crassostreae TaxID=154981 RepID=A0A0P7ITL9_9RHOB|nr:periplasmic heavy metal sensor [Aliiroseovarius crassostreae]KPN62183.1 hypothetical protein AKJ29_07915 [Aliiroseovarius crassostreae]SFU53928.1 Heavy-metal resistance [Aliiroseovarius crassostreae]
MTDYQTPPQPEQIPVRKRRKWVRALFVASLTLNLLVIGLVAGAKISDRGGHGFDPRGPERGLIRDLGLGPIASSLSREDRRAIGRALREQQGSFREKRTALKRDFDRMLELLRADPYDRDQLESIMTAQRNRVLEFGDVARGLVLERIEQMSHEERQELAEALSQNVRFDRRKHPIRNDYDCEKR